LAASRKVALLFVHCDTSSIDTSATNRLNASVLHRQTILESFGQQIVEHRKALGISQEELAFRSDLDRTYVSGLERGVRNPSLTAVVKVAHGLGITPDKLLKGLQTEKRRGK
jgi:ribosome-binding protein aMBF1 (putative translation factor)